MELTEQSKKLMLYPVQTHIAEQEEHSEMNLLGFHVDSRLLAI